MGCGPSRTQPRVCRYARELRPIASQNGRLCRGGASGNPRAGHPCAEFAPQQLRLRRVRDAAVIILPGVPHGFKELDGTITYFVTRIESTQRYSVLSRTSSK